MTPIQIKNLGLISYDDATIVMEELHEKCVDGTGDDTLLILEHHPVITKGRRMQDLRIPRENEILDRGIQIRQADRGGLLTYHGPGQIVIYFVIRLERFFDGISAMVGVLEKTLLDFLETRGAPSTTVQDHPGVWIDGLKIASLGLRVSRGVTKHGISLNISNELSMYGLFDPCGLSGETMTNLETVTDRKILPAEFHALASQLVEDFHDNLRDCMTKHKLIA